MTLLIFYLALALGVSFLCSLMEASLLSTPSTHAKVLTRQGSKVGPMMEEMKNNIDRPLAAILTLNTAAHTIGAAGVGAQSLVVFGSVSTAVVSGVLTLLILVLSEIIPKTIGAVYARQLTVPMVYTVKGMIYLTWPLIVVLDAFSRMLRGKRSDSGLTREQILIIAELARTEGALRGAEAQIIQNMLRLNEIHVEEIMTPRTVVFMVQKDSTVKEVVDTPEFKQFTRIPLYDKSPDDLAGWVLKADLYEALRNGEGEKKVSALKRTLHAVPEVAPLLRVLEEFARRSTHIFQVVDEYGGTAGILTLEDVVESVIGREIMDETDAVADLRRLAQPK